MAKLHTDVFQEAGECVSPQGTRVGVSRAVKLSPSAVTLENRLNDPHGNIHWQFLSGAVQR